MPHRVVPLFVITEVEGFVHRRKCARSEAVDELVVLCDDRYRLLEVYNFEPDLLLQGDCSVVPGPALFPIFEAEIIVKPVVGNTRGTTSVAEMQNEGKQLWIFKILNKVTVGRREIHRAVNMRT